jgi:hypothetical protein
LSFQNKEKIKNYLFLKKKEKYKRNKYEYKTSAFIFSISKYRVFISPSVSTNSSLTKKKD